MKLRNRLGLAIATGTLGIAGTLGLGACSPGTAAAAMMTPEQSALTTLGFSDADLTANTAPGATTAGVSATPSATPTGKKKHPKLRRLALRRIALRNHVQHGQITVETKTGDQTIDVQRGAITAITATSVTVKSADGFSETWTFGTPIKVVDAGTKSQTSALKTGETVGIAGLGTGSPAARLIVVPKTKN